MSWHTFFGRPKRESAALFDIGSGSVGGAYAVFEDGMPPRMVFSRRVSIENREGESLEASTLRACALVANALTTEGPNVLRQIAGDARVTSIFVTLSSPWQKTSARTQTIEEKKPFVFTKSQMQAAMSTEKHDADWVSTGEFVIGTLLNGYKVENPFGKRVTRVDMNILSSAISGKMRKGIEEIIRHAFHSHAGSVSAFIPVAYEVFRDLYPHEKEFMLIDVSSEATDIACVHEGVLVDAATAPAGIGSIVRASGTGTGIHAVGGELVDPARTVKPNEAMQKAQDAWITSLRDTLSKMGETRALPRTVFLLSNKETRDYLKKTLGGDALHPLWLSDEPLKILPVIPSHFTPLVKTIAESEGDVSLMILALSYAKAREMKGGR